MKTQNNTQSIYKLGTTFFHSYYESYLTITAKIIIGQKWILTWESNPNNYLYMTPYEISKALEGGQLILAENLHN